MKIVLVNTEKTIILYFFPYGCPPPPPLKKYRVIPTIYPDNNFYLMQFLCLDYGTLHVQQTYRIPKTIRLIITPPHPDSHHGGQGSIVSPGRVAVTAALSRIRLNTVKHQLSY